MTESEMAELRCCPMCEKIKPLSQFGRNVTRKSGISTYCRSCNVANSRIIATAMRRTRDEHYDTYRRFLDEERVKAGLAPSTESPS